MTQQLADIGVYDPVADISEQALLRNWIGRLVPSDAANLSGRRELDLINALHEQLGADASRQTVGDFLGEVFAKISAHFALEETVMRKHRYDEYAEHKADHEKLLDDLRDIMDDFESGTFVDYRAALSGAVRDWGKGPMQKIEGRVITVVDCLGDYREEVITSVKGELRIYTTTIPATDRKVWLMQDHQYRMGVVAQTMGYYYPAQLGK